MTPDYRQIFWTDIKNWYYYIWILSCMNMLVMHWLVVVDH